MFDRAAPCSRRRRYSQPRSAPSAARRSPASGSATPLSPQSVLDWNTHAWTLVSQAQHPREVTPPATRSLFPTEGLIYISYVQAAVYNAAVAIGGRYNPYGLSLFAPAGASADAAVAQAAHDTLNYYLNDPSGPYLTADAGRDARRLARELPGRD